MRRTHVLFNGIDLTECFYVSDLQEPLLPREVGTADVPGMDGALFTGVRLMPRTIALTLTVKDKSMEGMRAAERCLAAILATKEPTPLSLSIDDGLYYMAVPSAAEAGALYRKAVRHVVEFQCPDPVAYGRERTVTVPSGGRVTFDVGGTYPTMPVVSARCVYTASGQQWRLALEDGTYLHHAWDTDAATAGTVTFDCAERVAKLGSRTFMLSAGADWLELEPGEHTLTMSGEACGGDATVTFRERWL